MQFRGRTFSSHTMEIDRVRGALFAAIEEINELRPLEDQVLPSDATVLMGPDSLLSSIDVVNFLVAAEGQLEERLGTTVDLTEHSGGAESLRTLGSLAAYVASILTAKAE